MIQFKVNGVERTFDGDPEMPVLWYLRDVLGLTGTKFGCGVALCGACTVHRNGEAIRSCVVPVRVRRRRRNHDDRRHRRKRVCIQSRKPGWISMFRNAATARQDRSCRRSPC